MRTKFVAVVLVLLGACAVDSSTREQRGDVHEGDEEECKIEGAAIGQVGATVTVDGTTITFLEWTPKADSPGEYVGFRLSDNAVGVGYVVKTGTEHYHAAGTEWESPYGDSGPDAHGISNVDFCHDSPCDYDAGVDDPAIP